MKSRIRLVLSRVRYAALGAAVGAGVGALISRNAASSGGALGALVGATFGETRVSAGQFLAEARERVTEQRGLRSDS